MRKEVRDEGRKVVRDEEQERMQRWQRRREMRRRSHLRWVVNSAAAHYGTKPGHFETLKIHFPTSEGVSEVSKRANE